ncbi:MAG: hypothetical protein WAV11_01730 [Minisyncoccia bacterium]
MNLLEKLRRRKSHEKNIIALTIAGIITFFIFIFWIYNVGLGLSQKQNDVELKDVSPMTFFEDNFSKVMTSFEQFPKAVEELKNANSSSTNVTNTAQNMNISTSTNE